MFVPFILKFIFLYFTIKPINRMNPKMDLLPMYEKSLRY